MADLTPAIRFMGKAFKASARALVDAVHENEDLFVEAAIAVTRTSALIDSTMEDYNEYCEEIVGEIAHIIERVKEELEGDSDINVDVEESHTTLDNGYTTYGNLPTPSSITID